MENKDISKLIEEYYLGLSGVGPILWHKKMHKNGSGDFACVRGIKSGCDSPVNCENCYDDKNGGYCLNFGGENVGGFLAVEYKHQDLVNKSAFGAYKSVSDAINKN